MLNKIAKRIGNRKDGNSGTKKWGKNVMIILEIWAGTLVLLNAREIFVKGREIFVIFKKGDRFL